MARRTNRKRLLPECPSPTEGPVPEHEYTQVLSWHMLDRVDPATGKTPLHAYAEREVKEPVVRSESLKAEHPAWGELFSRLFPATRVRIHIDVTEPGALAHEVSSMCEGTTIVVERSILHKREGLGASAREAHPLYGSGADYVICDPSGQPVAGIERKTLEDLAKSTSLDLEGGKRKIFRQLKDLTRHPMPVLMLEGLPGVLYRRLEPAAIGIQSWCARQGIAIVTTTSPMASARAVFLIARKLGSELAVGAPDSAWGAVSAEAPTEP